MCGIAGAYITHRLPSNEQLERATHSMLDAIRHRGPDASGVYIKPMDSAALALGHRRLSILDLTEAGAQPMHSHDGRWSMVFNGEIYNFQALRTWLESRRGAIAWRGHSDTEVLLELIAEVGPQESCARLDGMFAFAVWDHQLGTLTLARDAFGEKPLYYGYSRGSFLFASELKALRTWPGFSAPEDPEALASFLKYSYIPAPFSIYKGIFKLMPGHTVTVNGRDAAKQAMLQPLAYWRPVESALTAQASVRGNAATGDFLPEIEKLLTDSVSRRMLSDVPLGALLSGGIDSSLVTAIMQSVSTRPVQTFTIGVAESGYNEAEHARAVSRHLGTEHHELMLTAADIQKVIPDIAGMYDEPFADSSQVPTYLVSRMARSKVTVVLSGDGGDELFSGYNRYFHGPRIWQKLERLPPFLRSAIAASLGSISPAGINRIVRMLGKWAPAELAAGRAGEKLHKLVGVMHARDRAGFHDGLLATHSAGRRLLSASHLPLRLPDRLVPELETLSFAEQAMLLDTTNYLPDDVLTKVDRASMAVSLEVRTPFLNRQLFELAWRMPQSVKVAGQQGKLPLRQILYRHVPQALVDRPKTGFGIPVGRWLRTDLRTWAEDLLSPDTLSRSGMFDVAAVRALWREHLDGQRNHESQLWSVLMYQGWSTSVTHHPEG